MKSAIGVGGRSVSCANVLLSEPRSTSSKCLILGLSDKCGVKMTVRGAATRLIRGNRGPGVKFKRDRVPGSPTGRGVSVISANNAMSSIVSCEAKTIRPTFATSSLIGTGPRLLSCTGCGIGTLCGVLDRSVGPRC